MKTVEFNPEAFIPDDCRVMFGDEVVVWWAYDKEVDIVIIRVASGVYGRCKVSDLTVLVPTEKRYINLYLPKWGKMYCKVFYTAEEAVEDVSKIQEGIDVVRVGIEVEL